jgi:hypothetical protein
MPRVACGILTSVYEDSSVWSDVKELSAGSLLPELEAAVFGGRGFRLLKDSGLLN